MLKNFIPQENIRCPDCSGGVVLETNHYRCKNCSRDYQVEGGVHHLLSKKLDECKEGENTIHLESNEDMTLVLEEPCRCLLFRKMFMHRFEDELLDEIKEGNFLELGGETSWASSLVKLRYPNSTVYASDVSPNALEHMGLKISRILDSPVDYFVACDAENIPFEDEFFDSIIMISSMHHLPHPEKMLKEVRRVLKTGGVFIVVDGAIPPWFRFLFKKEAEERAKKHGIIENLISFGEWENILEDGGMSKDNITPYTNPKYVEGFIHRMGASILNRLPERIIKRGFHSCRFQILIPVWDIINF